MIVAAAPAIVAAAQSLQVFVATSGATGAALLTRGAQTASTQGQRLLTAAQGVITRFNINQVLKPRRLKHIFDPKHANELLGTRMEAINKVVNKVFELDAAGAISRGVLNLEARIDGLSVTITGFISETGVLNLSNFWINL